MRTIDLQQLKNQTEHFVQAARQDDIQIRAGGEVVAVLSRPRNAEAFRTFWEQRERTLAQISMKGTWDSAAAVSSDRDRL